MENNHNDKLYDIVKKVYEPHKLLRYKDRFVQNFDPIYQDPEAKGPLSFRTHFFSPSKPIFGRQVDTFTFNIIVVWMMALGLYVLLYFNVIGRLVNKLNRK